MGTCEIDTYTRAVRAVYRRHVLSVKTVAIHHTMWRCIFVLNVAPIYHSKLKCTTARTIKCEFCLWHTTARTASRSVTTATTTRTTDHKDFGTRLARYITFRIMSARLLLLIYADSIHIRHV